MANWGELSAADPVMAAAGRALIEAAVPPEDRRADSFTGYAFMATTRADGAPRLAPMCPVMAGGRLFLVAGPATLRLRDLRRDGRYVLHAFLGPSDHEFAVRGRAVEQNDPGTRSLVTSAAAPWMPVKDEEILFELDIEEAYTTTWEQLGQPDTRAMHRTWKAAPR